jgi:predicted TIM-barrel fold metal-dependent hydrolase
MVEHYRAEPKRLMLCASFDATLIDAPDFAEKVVEQLRLDIVDGATMVKVWKEIGMVIKDASGAFIQIDDPRFQPIWDFLIDENIPVLAHIGEPRAAWLPLDENSPHYGYYRNNPQYHAYQHPEVPSWEAIMAARDRWLGANPELTVVGAHIGSMAYDVDEVSARLDAYPNFYAGTAARFGDLAKQPSDKVRAFFIRYQDRLLYGTDLGIGSPVTDQTAQAIQAERDRLDHRFTLHRDYLAGSDSLDFADYGMSYAAPTKGLALPDSVLRKFYAGNAMRVLGVEKMMSAE